MSDIKTKTSTQASNPNITSDSNYQTTTLGGIISRLSDDFLTNKKEKKDSYIGICLGTWSVPNEYRDDMDEGTRSLRKNTTHIAYVRVEEIHAHIPDPLEGIGRIKKKTQVLGDGKPELVGGLATETVKAITNVSNNNYPTTVDYIEGSDLRKVYLHSRVQIEKGDSFFGLRSTFPAPGDLVEIVFRDKANLDDGVIVNSFKINEATSQNSDPGEPLRILNEVAGSRRDFDVSGFPKLGDPLTKAARDDQNKKVDKLYDRLDNPNTGVFRQYFHDAVEGQFKRKDLGCAVSKLGPLRGDGTINVVLQSIAMGESSLDPNTVKSNDGDGRGTAYGLMQVNSRFHRVHDAAKPKEGGTPRVNIQQNIQLGAKVFFEGAKAICENDEIMGVIKGDKDLFLRTAIANYNASIGSIKRALNAGKDPDAATTGYKYSRNVMARVNRIKEKDSSKSQE